ncbi:MAG: hypothetical protein ABII82_20210 [Verrucomicrobiota bacterium]
MTTATPQRLAAGPWLEGPARSLWHQCGYQPHVGQARVHASQRRFRVACCGTRWGKSFLGGAELLLTLQIPGTASWIVGPTYALAQFEWRWLMDLLIRGGLHPRFTATCIEATGRTGGRLVLKNGSWVETKSADHPTGLLGVELDLLVAGEASQIPAVVWERYLRARLVSRHGRLLVATTPAGTEGWVRDLYDQGQEQRAIGWRGIPEAEQIESWAEPTWNNPYVSWAEVQAARRQLPDLVFREQFGAEFVALSGRIYPEFQPASHVRHELPAGWQHWPRWRGVDFGWTNPAGCVWLALQPGTRVWWVLGEVYGSHMDYADFATLIREHPLSHPGNRIVASLGDSEDPQGLATLTRCGVAMAEEVTREAGDRRVKLDKSVMAGLMTVKARLRGDGNGDGPRLVFVAPEAFDRDAPYMLAFNTYLANERVRAALDSKIRQAPDVGPGCPNALREIQNYVWDTEGDHTLDRPAPHQADHLLDPLRYLLHTLDPLDRSPIRVAAGGGPRYGDVKAPRPQPRQGVVPPAGSWARRYR